MGGLSLGWVGLAPKKWNKKAKEFIEGTPEKRENVSTLREDQEPLYQQLQNSAMGEGAGGAFGDSADYYRDLLSNDSQTFNQMQAPEMRKFNEQIIPDLAEQFAGYGGSGSLQGSGFRNAAVNAGTDLSERLGSIRAQLRQQGAQGLQNIGQQGLQNYSQNMVTEQGTQGLLGMAAPAIGAAATAYGGPALGAAANSATNWLQNSNKGTTSPYGGGNKLPGFQTSMR